MKIIFLILLSIFYFGFIWFGRLAWIAAQKTGTGYIGELFINGSISVICVLIAIGLTMWAILI